jgi:hypothetical protein
MAPSSEVPWYRLRHRKKKQKNAFTSQLPETKRGIVDTPCLDKMRRKEEPELNFFSSRKGIEALTKPGGGIR